MNSRQTKGLTDFIKYTVEKDKLTEEHTLDDDGHNLEKRWFINNKVLTIRNKIISPESYKVVLPIMDGEKVKYPQGRFLVKEEWDNLSEDDQKKCVKYYLFDEYFKTIIMPYVMQVIPSTTILKLKNFSA